MPELSKWEKLLEAFTLSEVLEQSNVPEAEVLEFLYDNGFLKDLPEEFIPL